jgi:hypothetical protein
MAVIHLQGSRCASPAKASRPAGFSANDKNLDGWATLLAASRWSDAVGARDQTGQTPEHPKSRTTSKSFSKEMSIRPCAVRFTNEGMT